MNTLQKGRISGRKRLENGHVYAKKPTDMIDKNIEKAHFHDVRIYDTQRGIFEVTTGRGNRVAGKGGKCALVCSWLRVHLSRSYSPHTLVYYLDSLDR